MTQKPRPRGVPEEKVLEERLLPDGKRILKIADRKGAGDFKVSVFDPSTKTWLTPSYAHFAIDLYGKLCRNENSTAYLLDAIEEVYKGATTQTVIEKLSFQGLLAQLNNLPGYSVEYTLNALELIFAQEDITWKRDFVEKGKPLPRIRIRLAEQGFFNEKEVKERGSVLAIHLLRRVVRDKIHPVEAMREAGLRITAGYA